jgi:DNA-binding MarR family transcriptional regulator
MNIFDISKDVFVLNNFIQSHFNNTLKKYDLTYIQAMLLITINEKQGVNQEHLSNEFQVSKSLIASRINKLIELDLIEVNKFKDDRRNNQIYLSETGKKTLNIIQKEIDSYNHQLLTLVSEFNTKALERNLKWILNNAKTSARK